MDKIAEEVRLLQAVYNATRVLNERATAGEFGQMPELMNERERLLNAVVDFQREAKASLKTVHEREEAKTRTMPLLEAIRKADDELVRTLRHQKKVVVEKLREAQEFGAISTYAK